MARLSGGTCRKFDTDQPSAARQTARNKKRNASLADCAQAPAGSAPSFGSGMVSGRVIAAPPVRDHGDGEAPAPVSPPGQAPLQLRPPLRYWARRPEPGTAPR